MYKKKEDQKLLVSLSMIFVYIFIHTIEYDHITQVGVEPVVLESPDRYILAIKISVMTMTLACITLPVSDLKESLVTLRVLYIYYRLIP